MDSDKNSRNDKYSRNNRINVYGRNNRNNSVSDTDGRSNSKNDADRTRQKKAMFLHTRMISWLILCQGLR